MPLWLTSSRQFLLLYIMLLVPPPHHDDFDYQADDKPLDDLQLERAVQSVTGIIQRGIGLSS